MPPRLLFSVCMGYLLLFVNNLFAQDVEQATPKLILPIGNRLQVLSAQFSPDNKKIVTASADKSILVWDVVSGSLLLNLNDHKAVVYYAEFSPDGKKIVSSSYDNMIKIWDAETGKELFTLKGHKGAVTKAVFSPDGKRIVSVSGDGTVKLWNVLTKRFVTDLKGHKGKIISARFNQNGTKIITSSADNTARVWDVFTGKTDTILRLHTGPVNSAQFSPNDKEAVTASSDGKTIIWNLNEKRNPLVLKGHSAGINTAQFSPDGTKIVTASDDKTAIIYDLANKEKQPLLLKDNNGKVKFATFNADGKKVCTVCDDNTVSVWDANSGQLDTVLKGHLGEVTAAVFSRDSTKLVTASHDGTTKLWDAKADSLLTTLKGRTYWVYSARVSADGKKIVTGTDDSAVKIWDAKTGALLNNLKGHSAAILAATFSPDGKNIITSSNDGTTRLWDLSTENTTEIIPGQTAPIIFAEFSPDGKKIVYSTDGYTAKIQSLGKDRPGFIELKTKKNKDSAIVYSAQFSPDGLNIITAQNDSTAKIWDAANGNLLTPLRGHEDEVLYAAYSPDSTKIITTSRDQTAIIWNSKSMQQDAVLVGHSDPVIYASFSPDSKKIVTASEDKSARIWEVKSGKLLFTLKGHTDWVNTAQFDSAGKKIITASGDNTIKVWNAENGKELYTFFAVDSTDYLVVDPSNHFDGTENARNLLYFTCGSEKIGLEQVKGDLWVPNLAERLNKGESIREKSLDQLDVCGRIPEVEVTGDSNKIIQFTITPRRDSLGETILFVNGIETARYKKEQLKNNNALLELNVNIDSLNRFLVAKEDNVVSVKTYTAGNAISSNEAKITIEKDSIQSVAKPNFYAVLIGTSQYREQITNSESFFDTKINLTYPAIDAKAISQTVEKAAKKMYGDDHVFMFTLTTDSADVLRPDKGTIKHILDSIGKKATANDILFLFLSGHGVVDDEDNTGRFYYMTSDASSLNDEKQFPEVGISTETLMEWINPKNIPAQKRILILDACHSGQVINDLLGAHEVKAMDKLSERSGLFILSASASKQSAFESDDYGHGFLTYSLLKVIKQQPDILEDGKNLNISRWFNAAGKSVNAMAEEEGRNQKTQIFSVIDFNIGEVDSSIISSIRLLGEKPMFIASTFQNADTVEQGDNLGLSKTVNEILREISSKGKESKIVFALSSPAGDVYSLSGSYKYKDNEIKIEIRVKKGKEKLCDEFEVTKSANESMKELADRIIKKAMDCVEANK